MQPCKSNFTEKEGHTKKNLQYFIILLLIVMVGMIAPGCKTTTAIITRFETEPQWICPGTDFSPEVHFRIENIYKDGKPSDEGTCLWKLLDTTKASAFQPGAVPLTNKVGNLNNPSKGVFETPPNGVHVVGGSHAQTYKFTLIASNTDCDSDCENSVKRNQKKIEDTYGVDLDDNEVMMAHTTVELISMGGPKRICVPHAIDVSGGWYWQKEEVRAGQRIVIDLVENINDFPLEVMPPGQPSKILSSAGQPGSRTHDFDGHSPNGKWKVKAPNNIDYQKYMKHGIDYVNKPSICINVGIRCQ